MRNIKAGGDSPDAYHCWLMVFRCPSDVFDYCMIYCTAVRSPGSNFPFFCATHELSGKVYGLFKHPDVIRIISRQAGLGLHPVWFWSPWQQSARLRRSCENTASQKSKITFFLVPECDQRGVTHSFYSSEVSCRSPLLRRGFNGDGGRRQGGWRGGRRVGQGHCILTSPDGSSQSHLLHGTSWHS